MRATTVLKNIIAVMSIFVRGFEFRTYGLVVDIRPTWRRPRCSCCHRPGSTYDSRPPRLWRHLGLGELRIWLRYAPRRCRCRHCKLIFTSPVVGVSSRTPIMVAMPWGSEPE